MRALDELNPWWSGHASRPSELYRRWAFSECRRRLNSKIAPVIAIRGTRQVGKTEIQLQLIEELIQLDRIPPRNVLRVQFDDLPSLGVFKEPLLAVVRWYEDNVLGEPINALAAKGEDVYLFFDELQNLPAWEAQLKFLADNRAARMIATGSSALRIGHGQDSLAGRLSLIELGTLRLREIAGIRKERAFPPYQNNGAVDDWTRLEFWRELAHFTKSHARAIRGAFKHFSNFGGYPICHKTKRPDASDLADLIVSMVVERTLLRDLKAGQLGSRRDLRVVEETFRRVCRYAGQPVQPAANPTGTRCRAPVWGQSERRRGCDSVS